MKLSTQQLKVYLYLKIYGKATVRELLPITNYPTCIIRDLKKKGINITPHPLEDKNYIEYRLEEIS